jgi:hypothetical protein
MALQPLTPDKARSLFTSLAITQGKEWTVAEYAPTGPDNGNCWQRAYETSIANGHAYVEGIVYKYGRFSNAHGWSVRTSLLGETVIESTEDYDKSATYKGFVIDLDNPHVREMTTIMEGQPRSSVIETALAAGVPFYKIRTFLKGAY